MFKNKSTAAIIINTPASHDPNTKKTIPTINKGTFSNGMLNGKVTFIYPELAITINPSKIESTPNKIRTKVGYGFKTSKNARKP